MKKNRKAIQQSAIDAVVKVRQQMQDLHKHYQKELALEKKYDQQELDYIHRESYDSVDWVSM